jgi:hypothetical protein
MGYMHIIQLYKCPEFFELSKEIYAMEKIHGTSAWITFKSNGDVGYFSGGENYENFKKLFNEGELGKKLQQISDANGWTKMRVHGEAYGGKQQGMCQTYGPNLKFIVFDVFVSKESDGHFLSVPEAERVAIDLGLEFVYYTQGNNNPKWIEEQAEMKSIQALRNGITTDKPREGVVVRPLTEMNFKDGTRAIAKYKNAEFWEISSRRPLGESVKLLDNVQQIVNEWVTDQRFVHVVDHVLRDKTDKTITFADIKVFMESMLEDVKREADGEIVWSIGLEKEIRRKTGSMFQKYMNTMKHT